MLPNTSCAPQMFLSVQDASIGLPFSSFLVALSRIAMEDAEAIPNQNLKSQPLHGTWLWSFTAWSQVIHAAAAEAAAGLGLGCCYGT